MTFWGAMICPHCETVLKSKNNDYFCSRCNKIYPNNNGIISFVDEKIEEKGYKKNILLLSVKQKKNISGLGHEIS